MTDGVISHPSSEQSILDSLSPTLIVYVSVGAVSVSSVLDSTEESFVSDCFSKCDVEALIEDYDPSAYESYFYEGYSWSRNLNIAFLTDSSFEASTF